LLLESEGTKRGKRESQGEKRNNLFLAPTPGKCIGPKPGKKTNQNEKGRENGLTSLHTDAGVQGGGGDKGCGSQHGGSKNNPKKRDGKKVRRTTNKTTA